ncbi:MAG TPA: rhomboid family intramembrane serine protease [Bauldia sp.]|nr:rhomboid family intramembrane serine protease [Bauldia sp.]
MAFIPIYDTNPLRNIRHPWVTWGFIAANVLIYFVYQHGTFTGESSQASAYDFGLIPALLNGETRPDDIAQVPDLLTLVSYSFLHADIWHLAGNMVFLWVFADNVEDAVGHFRFFFFYLACAALSGYAFVLSDPGSESPLIGASGAVSGMIAAYLLLYPRVKVWILVLLRLPLRLRVEWVLGFWIFLQVLSAFSGEETDVAWWAHLGGLAAGALLILVLRLPGVPLFAKALPDDHPLFGRRTAPEPAPIPAASLPPPPDAGQHPGDNRGPWE